MFVAAIEKIIAHRQHDVDVDIAGQAPDHPVSAACLEGRYLKFLLARVI